MKQQTTAIIDSVLVEENRLPLAEQSVIELELSAIDTGGGFHDPILDFVYELRIGGGARLFREGDQRITLVVCDPSDIGNTLTITYEGNLRQIGDHHWQGMGRLSGGEAGRKIVTFIMRCVRS